MKLSSAIAALFLAGTVYGLVSEIHLQLSERERREPDDEKVWSFIVICFAHNLTY